MRLSTIKTCMLAGLALILASPTLAQEKPGFPELPVVDLPHEDLRQWAVALPLMFEGGKWFQTDEVVAQACNGPSDAGYTGEFASLVRVVGPQGEVLRERRIANPRLILPEEQKEAWRPAEFAEVIIIIGLADGAQTVQFFADARKPEQPTFEADVREAVELARLLAKEMAPACQGNNPPVVPVGREGRFVLAYALRHAARVADIAPSELLEMMSQSDSFELRYKLSKALPLLTREMLLESMADR